MEQTVVVSKHDVNGAAILLEPNLMIIPMKLGHVFRIKLGHFLFEGTVG